MNRYSMGFFKGAPAMFEQPDGDYVKWSDVEGARKLMAMSEAEIDAELRALGIDPATAAQKGADAITGAIAQAKCGGYVCGMCGKGVPHQHTPEEVTIFRNGIKRGAGGVTRLDGEPLPLSGTAEKDAT